jgi:hypothetical protein
MTVTFKLERLDATPSVQDQLVWRPGDRLHLGVAIGVRSDRRPVPRRLDIPIGAS